jgi:hypothetical protein
LGKKTFLTTSRYKFKVNFSNVKAFIRTILFPKGGWIDAM